jgi:hypothetical protein
MVTCKIQAKRKNKKIKLFQYFIETDAQTLLALYIALFLFLGHKVIKYLNVLFSLNFFTKMTNPYLS